MRAFIAGGTGFLGSHLLATLRSRGEEPTVLSREGARATGLQAHGVKVIFGDVNQPGDWRAAVAGHDVVVNLVGESLAAGRWTPERKQAIRESRIQSTRVLVEACRQATPRPSTLVNASAIGYYGDNRTDNWLVESDPAGRDFLADLTMEWEQEAMTAEAFGMRVLCIRTGLVLGPDGGALPKMLPVFQRGLGGPLGSGHQWYSWIHVDDWVRLVLFCIEAAMDGPVNAVAPNPVPMRAFARALGRVLHRPALLPVPEFVLRLALGDMADVLLSSQRVSPKKVRQAGFQFRFPDLEPALRNVIARMRHSPEMSSDAARQS